MWAVPIALIPGCDGNVIKYNQVGAEALRHPNTGTGFSAGRLLGDRPAEWRSLWAGQGRHQLSSYFPWSGLPTPHSNPERPLECIPECSTHVFGSVTMVLGSVDTRKHRTWPLFSECVLCGMIETN